MEGRCVQTGSGEQVGVFALKAVNLTPNTIISALASIRFNSLLDGPSFWVQSVRSILLSSEDALDGNNLASLISWCKSLGSKDVRGGFLQTLSAIQLAFKCQKLMGKGDQEVSVAQFYCAKVLHLHQAPVLQTFQDWLSYGAKFA
ncbi:hypothetical protein SCLCIDRAFT_18921 [Scleroderma citrinum Foug A]|uniref:Uncharacterized protein n=1 Tax=Scleroderma citrinum Foug A TaxID=1036808 RepID=A0A0C3A856_9AGAM|nr:hypothetical protein SCLCIDRAFT_18921 [Scleroderma citrinum Foug A]